MIAAAVTAAGRPISAVLASSESPAAAAVASQRRSERRSAWLDLVHDLQVRRHAGRPVKPEPEHGPFHRLTALL
jgi:hypothetical protein